MRRGGRLHQPSLSRPPGAGAAAGVLGRRRADAAKSVVDRVRRRRAHPSGRARVRGQLHDRRGAGPRRGGRGAGPTRGVGPVPRCRRRDRHRPHLPHPPSQRPAVAVRADRVVSGRPLGRDRGPDRGAGAAGGGDVRGVSGRRAHALGRRRCGMALTDRGECPAGPAGGADRKQRARPGDSGGAVRARPGAGGRRAAAAAAAGVDPRTGRDCANARRDAAASARRASGPPAAGGRRRPRHRVPGAAAAAGDRAAVRPAAAAAGRPPRLPCAAGGRPRLRRGDQPAVSAAEHHREPSHGGRLAGAGVPRIPALDRRAAHRTDHRRRPTAGRGRPHRGRRADPVQRVRADDAGRVRRG